MNTKLEKVDLSGKDIDAILEAFDIPGVDDYATFTVCLNSVLRELKYSLL